MSTGFKTVVLWFFFFFFLIFSEIPKWLYEMFNNKKVHGPTLQESDVLKII